MKLSSCNVSSGNVLNWEIGSTRAVRVVGQGEVGAPEGYKQHGHVGLGHEKLLVGARRGHFISLLRMNRLTKQSPCLIGPPLSTFLAVKFFPSLDSSSSSLVT